MSTATNEINDQTTATAALRKAQNDLVNAIGKADDGREALAAAIVNARPAGVLTVDEIGEAVGRDRNFVDTTWSQNGDSTRHAQTRVEVNATDEEREAAVKVLADAASYYRTTKAAVPVARAERDRVVVMVYASKILGPSAIAREVGIDRNSVLRTARKAGVKPQHRVNIKNQFSK
ncbi:hypothetical protein SEA_MISCHIEF19_65 [Streptomyces phage Mischief19]|nr:hypothetical protein SEA_MISCHIEF19_65 [Streptomyces phage Mischief19]